MKFKIREPREVGVETLRADETSKFFNFDQRTGETIRCNARGEPVARFEADFSGVAPTKDRVRRGMSVPILEHGLQSLPKHIGRPAKYVGFTCMPRPGLDMNARGKQCAFTLPEYLHPVEHKLGRVSTKRKQVQKKVRRVSSEPTFMECLDSQFVETVSMNSFIDNNERMGYYKPGNWDDVAKVKGSEVEERYPPQTGCGEYKKIRSAHDLKAFNARNRQKYIERVENEINTSMEPEEEVSLKGHFGVKRPPFNPKEIKDIETVRDRLIFPEKWQKVDDAFKVDKAGVRKRRRDRYPEHFMKIDAIIRAQEQAAAAQDD